MTIRIEFKELWDGYKLYAQSYFNYTHDHIRKSLKGYFLKISVCVIFTFVYMEHVMPINRLLASASNFILQWL